MKSYLLIFLFVSIVLDLAGQVKSDTIYYNTRWEITSRGNAHYYRIAHFDAEKMCFTGEVKDYNMNNLLQMVGHYLNCKRDGDFVFFNKEEKETLRISYKNGNRYGSWFVFDQNEIVLKHCKYVNDYEYVINYKNGFNEEQVQSGYGKINDTMIYQKKNIKYTIKGQVKDSLKVGRWKIYDSKGTKILVDKYKSGRLIHRKPAIINSSYGGAFLMRDFFVIEVPEKLKITESLAVERGIKIKPNGVLIAIKENLKKERRLILSTNVINGYDGLQSFLDTTVLFNKEELMNYPQDDTVIIQFSHHPDYTLSNIKFAKPSYSEGLNEELLNVFKSIDRIILEEAIKSPVRIKYMYKLKFPLSHQPEFFVQ